MKYRKGFVSNSSTVSFVLLGFDVSDRIADDFWQVVEGLGANLITEDEGATPKGVSAVVGKYLLYVYNEDDWSPESISLEESMDSVRAIRDQLGCITPIRIWTGSTLG